MSDETAVQAQPVAPAEAKKESKRGRNVGCALMLLIAIAACAVPSLLPAAIQDEMKIELPHVTLAADKLFHVGPLTITNTMLATWATMIVLLVVSFLATRKMKLVPSGLQNVVEFIVEALHNFVKSSAGQHTSKLLPIVGTLFLFIMLSNWMGLLPGYGSIWIELGDPEHSHRAHLLRSANTGLNTTLALAAISVTWTQVFGFRVSGWRFIDRYFPIMPIIESFRPKPGQKKAGGMDILVKVLNIIPGLLEAFAEMIKVLSFSFRLFGNVFAGEVLLFVIAFLLPYFVSLPFMGLELFVGFIQAFIFATLTVAFSMAAVAHHGDAH